MANSVDPDQTAPIGAVCSGSTLFASILNWSVMLGNYLQQTTSADNIFRCLFFLGALRVNLKIGQILVLKAYAQSLYSCPIAFVQALLRLHCLLGNKYQRFMKQLKCEVKENSHDMVVDILQRLRD